MLSEVQNATRELEELQKVKSELPWETIKRQREKVKKSASWFLRECRKSKRRS